MGQAGGGGEGEEWLGCEQGLVGEQRGLLMENAWPRAGSSGSGIG